MASPHRNGETQGFFPLKVQQVRQSFGSGIENAKLVGMVLNKQEKINEEGVTFIFEDETDKIDCHIRLCDMKEMAPEIENEMYAEIHVSLKDFQSTNRLEVFSVRRVTDDKQVVNHYMLCGHFEVPRMPGYYEIKEKILECLTMPEHMARYAGIHLDEVLEHCKAASFKYQDVMAVLHTLEYEDLVYQPRNSYYQACRSGC